MCSIWITVQDIYANLIAKIHHDPRAKPVKFPEWFNQKRFSSSSSSAHQFSLWVQGWYSLIYNLPLAVIKALFFATSLRFKTQVNLNDHDFLLTNAHDDNLENSLEFFLGIFGYEKKYHHRRRRIYLTLGFNMQICLMNNFWRWWIII